MTFPFPSGCPDEELLKRWEALLGKAPRLAPWLDQTLRGRRSVLQAHAGGLQIEAILWRDLSRWLPDFEALPTFAVSAIATTLEEKREPPPPPRVEDQIRVAESADRNVTELEALAADPAFALAFHCVESSIRPHLTPLLPETAWLGLLHASAPAEAELTPGVAVGLVLRLASAGWQERPSEQRRAALRAFLLSPADLRANVALLARLCASLPFPLSPAQLPELASSSARLRKAFAEAVALCGRLVQRLSGRPGGLSLLQQDAAEPASEAEVAELRATARRHNRMAGFDRLVCLL
jgi:hypothetical protein